MLSNLPLIPDQSHINKVRDALWSRPDAGASVMVGSGFSRNANKTRPDAGEPPLWDDIAKEIVKKLYPRSADGGRSGTGAGALSPEHALRLAQEYKTGFGSSELHGLLEHLVRDDQFTPGDEHSRLLRLPWRDVFTTNWDTLLERASSNVTERAYSVVQDMGQLPLMSQPRIVKLHGSFPASFPLVLTEEDYRIYPTKSAPFVNTVQQAMMETVFLLVGFSGDDPNFLNWSGWVRDNLGEAAPKIYLAGWLDLSPHRRRMLEDRGVVPVDLALHPRAHTWPEHQQHQYATEWVLHTLERGRPYDKTTWPTPPSREEATIPEYLQPVDELVDDLPENHPGREWRRDAPFYENAPLERVKQVLDTWARNRKLYPGWLVFPSGQERNELSRTTDEWESPILEALPEFPPIDRLFAIRELLWRRGILLEPITTNLDAAAQDALNAVDCDRRTVEGISDPRDDWANVRDAWRTVALALVTAARLDVNEPSFEQRLQALAPFSSDAPDVGHRIHQERCLWAIYSLDFNALNELLDNWPVENCDPTWTLRKAALLTEADRHDESRALVQSSLNSIRKDLAGDGGIATASREGWALGSTWTSANGQAIFRRWNELASVKCHAWTELNNLTHALRGTEEQKEAPPFDLGVRSGSGIRFSNEGYARLIAAFRAVRLPEVAGLPPVNNPGSDGDFPMTAASGILALAADELVATNPELAIRLALRICKYDKDNMLQRVLSRTSIAVLPDDSVARLAQICTRAIHYALPRLIESSAPTSGILWVERMRVAMEALSRLALRLTPDMAKTALDVGLMCYRTPHIAQHPLLGSPITSLLRRSWEALPKEHRANCVFDVMTLPIAGMEGFSREARLSDPGTLVSFDDWPAERKANDEHLYREVVNLLVRAIRDNYDARKRATLRLFSLSRSGNLTDSEKAEIAGALWNDSDPVLLNSSSIDALFDWTYLIMPQLTQRQAEQSFRCKWLTRSPKSQEEGTYSSEMLAQVGVAITELRSLGCPFELSGEEQEHVVSHAARLVESLSSGSVSLHLDFRSTIRGMRSILAEVKIPREVAEDLFQKADWMLGAQHDLRTSRETPLVDLRKAIGFGLIPGLVKALPDRMDTMVSWLKTGLASDDDLRVSYAVSVLRFWLSEPNSVTSTLHPMLDDLVLEIGVIIASRRRVALTDALWCATHLFERSSQGHQDTVSRLVLQGLSYLAEELRYDRDHQDGDDVPTLRWLSAGLARTMARHGFDNDATVAKWLDIGGSDPFPEVRSAVVPLE